MGTASFVCKGTEEAMRQTFGSTCHGAGRVMSRSQALKRAQGRAIDRELQAAGIIVRSQGRKTLAEEMPEAYKDVERVVGVMDARRHLAPRRAAAAPGGRQGLRIGRVPAVGDSSTAWRCRRNGRRCETTGRDAPLRVAGRPQPACSARPAEPGP